MAQRTCAGRLDLSADDQYRILDSYRSLTVALGADLAEMCEDLDRAAGDFNWVDLAKDGVFETFTAAWMTLKRGGRFRAVNVEPPDLVELTEAITKAAYGEGMGGRA